MKRMYLLTIYLEMRGEGLENVEWNIYRLFYSLA
jgi:hypothetical protein